MRFYKISLILLIILVSFLLYNQYHCHKNDIIAHQRLTQLKNAVIKYETFQNLRGVRLENLQLTPIVHNNQEKLMRKDVYFKLYAFFSGKGCYSCLVEESSEWERLFLQYPNIQVYAICTDSSQSNAYRYKMELQPSFPIFIDENHWKDHSGIKDKNPLILFTTRSNIILNAYQSRYGDSARRQKSYHYIEQIIKDFKINLTTR